PRLPAARTGGGGRPRDRQGARPARPPPRRQAPLPSPPLRPEGHAMTTRSTNDHEDIRVDGSTGTVGVTAYAQEQLGDIVYVELPTVGKVLAKGDEAAVVESVKAASEIYAPVAGTVTEVNDALSGEPGLINSSPDADGW